jgi:hypothetical protein
MAFFVAFALFFDCMDLALIVGLNPQSSELAMLVVASSKVRSCLGLFL